MRGLNVNYYSGIDYTGAPGEAIFINSNLILTEPAVSASGERPLMRGGKARGDNGQNSGYLSEPSRQRKRTKKPNH